MYLHVKLDLYLAQHLMDVMILRMMRWKSMFQYLHLMLRRMMTMEELLIISDTMVCTGCCATLDHIVTYLFKKVTNKGRYQTQIGTMLNLVASYSWKESARISNLG